MSTVKVKVTVQAGKGGKGAPKAAAKRTAAAKPKGVAKQAAVPGARKTCVKCSKPIREQPGLVACSAHRCHGITATGARKGERCLNTALFGDRCKSHAGAAANKQCQAPACAKTVAPGKRLYCALHATGKK